MDPSADLWFDSPELKLPKTMRHLNRALNNNEATGYSDAGSFIFQAHKVGVTKNMPSGALRTRPLAFAPVSSCLEGI
jgi:hypothetical protein